VFHQSYSCSLLTPIVLQTFSFSPLFKPIIIRPSDRLFLVVYVYLNFKDLALQSPVLCVRVVIICMNGIIRERERGRSRDRLFGRKKEPWEKEKRKDAVEMSRSGMI
jgi:hypothetical protein